MRWYLVNSEDVGDVGAMLMLGMVFAQTGTCALIGAGLGLGICAIVGPIVAALISARPVLKLEPAVVFAGR